MKSQGFEVTRATYFGASAVQWSILFPNLRRKKKEMIIIILNFH